MELVSWLSLLVMCIFGMLSFSGKRRPSGNIVVNYYVSPPQPEQKNRAVTRTKASNPMNYDDPTRSITIN